jgi:HK97 family phage portal protein
LHNPATGVVWLANVGFTDLLLRSIQPSEETPNDNTPAEAFPNTVGPPDVNPGDPHGVTVAAAEPQYSPPPPSIVASAWSGWPAEWQTPAWGQINQLADTAWACVDLNARILASMPPYLVNAAPTLDSEWLRNPDPDIYSSWEEFAKQLFWDWYLGEAFVLATGRYSTGWPARFHVVPPWAVNVEMDAGFRRYFIGRVDVTGDLLHLRYQSSVDDAHGHGPLEAGQTAVINATVLSRYARGVTSSIPPSLLEAPEEMSPDQAEQLRNDWVAQRTLNPGIPAVLSGGLKWTPTQLNAQDMALLELMQFNDSRIAVLLGVPPFLVGLPAGGDSMTYSNVTSLFDYHWRSGLRPTATAVMAGLSEWLLPRQTTVDVNKDAYVQPPPLERAQTAQILVAMGAMSVEEVRAAEMLDTKTEGVIAGPVLAP